MRSLRLAIVGVVLLAAACTGDGFGDLNPIEEDAGEAGITIHVVGCELDDTTGNVTATVEVTSEREYRTVTIGFELKDAQGTVVATTATSATNVQPGEIYRLEMPLAPAGELGEGFTCEADLQLATEPIG